MLQVPTKMGFGANNSWYDTIQELANKQTAQRKRGPSSARRTLRPRGLSHNVCVPLVSTEDAPAEEAITNESAFVPFQGNGATKKIKACGCVSQATMNAYERCRQGEIKFSDTSNSTSHLYLVKHTLFQICLHHILHHVTAYCWNQQMRPFFGLTYNI